MIERKRRVSRNGKLIMLGNPDLYTPLSTIEKLKGVTSNPSSSAPSWLTPFPPCRTTFGSCNIISIIPKIQISLWRFWQESEDRGPLRFMESTRTTDLRRIQDMPVLLPIMVLLVCCCDCLAIQHSWENIQPLQYKFISLGSSRSSQCDSEAESINWAALVRNSYAIFRWIGWKDACASMVLK